MAWILIFHLFGIIVWLGSILLITSLMALVPNEVGSARERIIIVGRRLFIVSGLAGMALTILTGLILILIRPELLRHGWLHAKLLLVAGLILVHARIHRRIGQLETDPGNATGAEFNILHGIASAFLLLILILVLLKPF